MRSALIVALVALLFAASCRAQQQVPAECTTAGTQLQTSCSALMSQAQSKLGISSDPKAAGKQVSKADLKAFLAANPPSRQCCDAAKRFAAADCGCNKAVQQVGAGFLGGDVKAFMRARDAVGQACGIATKRC